MPSVRLFHWRPEEAGLLVAKLREAGYRVVYRPETQSPSVSEIRESKPAAIVIDLSRLPSHGRYVAAWLRGSKSTRHIPVVFAGGDPLKVEAIKREIPDAVYTSMPRIGVALKRAIAAPPREPVVPRQMMQPDPSRTTAQKLGIRAGSRIALIDPPPGYAKVLGMLPPDVVIEENSGEPGAEPRPMTLWFVHDPGEYEQALARRRNLAKDRLWILWQKGRRDGWNGTLIRKAALAMGLVDYKVCSLDGVWSGMLFAVKKPRP